MNGSAERRGRVAFVELYRQWPAYFLDSFMAIQAADLRAAGHEVVWCKGFLLDDTQRTLQSLEARLTAEGPWDLLVLERLWSRDLLQRLVRAAGDPPVVISPWMPPASWKEVTYRIAPPSRAALSDLVEQLCAGATPESPNLFTRQPSGRWTSPSDTRPLAIREQFQAPVHFAYDAVTVFGLPAEEVAKTRYLMLNMGCPYRTATNPTRFLEGLKLSTPWGAAGCTFCNVGPYEVQTADDRAELVDAQLKALAQHGAYERLVVIDEFVFRDLDLLATALLAHAPKGVEVMVRARVDYLETYQDVLVQALEILADHGSITPYLVGFENFSDDELRRYNKGQSAEETLSAAQALIALSERWLNLNLSPSQGFILFGPWTTLEDLKRNADALGRVDFRALRGGITRSKLRINPDAALAAKAHADGLLIQSHRRDDEDNAAETGYQAELPYRFADPKTEQVWALLNGPKPIRGDSEHGRLCAAIAQVEGA